MHKTRVFRSPYGVDRPLLPRRPDLSLRRRYAAGEKPVYPFWHYKWPERIFPALLEFYHHNTLPSKPNG